MPRQFLSTPSSQHSYCLSTHFSLLCTLESRGDSLLPELHHLRVVQQVSRAPREVWAGENQWCFSAGPAQRETSFSMLSVQPELSPLLPCCALVPGAWGPAFREQQSATAGTCGTEVAQLLGSRRRSCSHTRLCEHEAGSWHSSLCRGQTGCESSQFAAWTLTLM